MRGRQGRVQQRSRPMRLQRRAVTDGETEGRLTFSLYCATAQHPYLCRITRPFSCPVLAPPALIPPVAPPPCVPSALFTIFRRSSFDGYPPAGPYESTKAVKAAFPPWRSLRSCSGVHLSMVMERTNLRPVTRSRGAKWCVRCVRLGGRSIRTTRLTRCERQSLRNEGPGNVDVSSRGLYPAPRDDTHSDECQSIRGRSMSHAAQGGWG